MPELKKHVEIRSNPGCDFLFAIDVNNPDIVIATEVYKDTQHTKNTSKLHNGATSVGLWRNTRREALM